METITWTDHDRPSARTLLYAIQAGKCRKCNEQFEKEELTIDHIKPSCEGGSNSIVNKQLLCLLCHRQKTSTETVMRLYVRLAN
jgi:5-methylcytosine-specific restriction endonuclease McrA